jgi:hypothetical protein
MAFDFTKVVQKVLSENKAVGSNDPKIESLKRQIKGLKNHMDFLQTNLDTHQERKKEQALGKLFKEELVMERDETMLNRYRIVHCGTGKVLGSHDDKGEAIKLGKQHGGFPHVKMVDSEKAT